MKITIDKDSQCMEYLKLYDLSLEELQITADKLTKSFTGNKVELCSIISAKTGKCEENCSYCAQSAHHKTNCTTHKLIDKQTVIKAALDAKNNGATRFCVVTSGKGIDDKDDFDALKDMISSVAEINNMHSCCSLGIVTKEEAMALKKAGLERFNHNVNTAKSFYKNICTTHDYEERINTIKNLKEAGIEICCGGIIGMGETRKQRIEMAMEIKELNPRSVPLNFLQPIPGTPLENIKNDLTPEEILKTIAIFRIIMPDVLIRYAGGRTYHLDEQEQKIGLNSGINALLIGNFLTTLGSTPQEDLNMIDQAGLELLKD